MALNKTKTTDEMMAALLRRCQTAVETIDELEAQVDDLRDKLKRDTSLSSVGMDEVFLMRELPPILKMLQDLPPGVRDDPCRRHELDLLTAVLQKVDAVVR